MSLHYAFFERLYHVLDTVILAGSGLMIGAGSTVLLLTAPNDAELQLLLLPLVGAVPVTGFTILINPQPETRNIVIARSGFALVVASLAPSLLALLSRPPFEWEWVAPVISIPAVLFALGACTAFITYVISKPFCQNWYANAEKMGRALAEESQKRLVHAVSTVVASDAKAVAAELRAQPIPDTTLNRLADKVVEKATQKLEHSPDAARAADGLAETISTKVIEKLP